MRIVCACGNSAPAAVLVQCFGPPPPTTVSLWSGACPRCAPQSGAFAWGWTLADGRRLGCVAERVLH